MTIELRHAVYAFVASALLLIGGCATGSEHELSPSKQMPGASGMVTVEQDDNGNQLLNIEVSHMPPPRELDGDLSTFVAWVKPDGSERATNVGALNIGEDRTAELQTTTPHPSFALVITAETTTRASEPSNYVVLKRQISRD